MLQLIIGIVAICVCYFVLKRVFSFTLKLTGGIAAVGVGVVIAPPFIVAYLTERFLSLIKLRWIVSLLLVVGLWIASAVLMGFEIIPDIKPWSFDSGKYLFSALLASLLLKYYNSRSELESQSLPLELFQKKRDSFYMLFLGSLSLIFVSVVIENVAGTIDPLYVSIAGYLGFAYWICSLLIQLYSLGYESELASLISFLSKQFDSEEKLEVSSTYFEGLKKKFSMLSNEEIEIVFHGVVAKQIQDGQVHELVIGDSTWIFECDFFDTGMSEIESQLSSKVKNSQATVIEAITDSLELPHETCSAFSEQHLGFGEFYDFEGGSNFVAFENIGRIRICESCGITEEVENFDAINWFCSDLCEKTEKLCLDIKGKPFAEFVAESATTGFTLIEGGKAWNKNQKIVARGGQGHGFAAEEANNKIDKILFRDAEIVGGNNQKNGADRLVDGISIQTKYCSTPGRSIGSAFDGQDGIFRYWNSDKTPMVIEVPRDQYQGAIKVMAKKIHEGKVPGVTDPARAADLVRKGHLTYQQTVNITKFGTFESLTYDIAEGAVVGTVAGGISFGITATLYYLRTDNPQEAMKVAALEAGKTFGKSMAVYVTAQQLHRIGIIQNVVSRIDISSFSPSVKNALQNGLGVQSTSAANKALRGTVVTAVAMVAVTTGPDLIKVISGKVSGAQFAKNLSVATSGVGGGMVGAIVGGSLGAPLGPVGIWSGQFLGGMIGGAIASAAANSIAKSFMREDAEIVMEYVKVQVKYLSKTFVLTDKEIDSLHMNLDKSINQKVLELIFQAKNNRRAMANFFVKPLVIGVVKQRPTLVYSVDDVIDACAEFETV